MAFRDRWIGASRGSGVAGALASPALLGDDAFVAEGSESFAEVGVGESGGGVELVDVEGVAGSEGDQDSGT
jgi:hypothetical protein